MADNAVEWLMVCQMSWDIHSCRRIQGEAETNDKRVRSTSALVTMAFLMVCPVEKLDRGG